MELSAIRHQRPILSCSFVSFQNAKVVLRTVKTTSMSASTTHWTTSRPAARRAEEGAAHEAADLGSLVISATKSTVSVVSASTQSQIPLIRPLISAVDPEKVDAADAVDVVDAVVDEAGREEEDAVDVVVAALEALRGRERASVRLVAASSVPSPFLFLSCSFCQSTHTLHS